MPLFCISVSFDYHFAITYIANNTVQHHLQHQWIKLWPFILTGLQVSEEAMSSGRGVWGGLPYGEVLQVQLSLMFLSFSFQNLLFLWQCRYYRASKTLKAYDQNGHFVLHPTP